MRRLIGLVALVALIYGAWWLVQNGYDMVRLAGGGMTASEDAAPATGGEQAAEAPAESAETPATPEGEGSTPKESAEAPATPPAAAGTAAGDAPEASAAAPAAPAATTSQSSESAEAPAGETSAPQTGTPAAGDVPTFDIVRVEPSGETVIAGLAPPNTTVELLDGPAAVATAEANERGEWALVLDKPLPPGTHDLAIRTTSKDKSTVTLSDQRVAVAVPEDKNEEPLVVLSSPDAPSSVMQAPKEPEIASAPPGAAGEGARSTESGSTPPTPSPSEQGSASAPPAEPSAPPASASRESETASAPSKPAPSSPEAPSAAAPGEPSPPTARQPDSDVAAAEPPPAAGGVGGGGAPGTGPSAPASPPAASEGQPTPPAVAEAPAKPAPQVGVAAVEAETDGSLYIAGTATERDPVRVYLDDELIGEAEPSEGGTWLLETKREVEPGDYTIRADQVESATGKVTARAEVPFEREIEVAVLKPSAEGADGGSAEMSGSIAGPMTVIIKRGDNLWRISRELYGRGVRYSTIYQANRDQIRNPNRIYPGQVFVLPAGDTAWQN